MRPQIVVIFTIFLVLPLFTGFTQKSTYAADSCISYNPLKREILLACDSASLSTIYDALGNPHILHEEHESSSSTLPSKIWLLNANVVVEKGAYLYITSKDTSWLKINSTSGIAYNIEVHGGNMLIDSVKISSWDTQKSNYATTNVDGTSPRSYILVDNGGGEGRIDIINSEISNLGSNHPNRFGLSVNNVGAEGSSYKNSSSSVLVKDSKIHDLWYGFYSHNADNAMIENSEFYYNNMYGLNVDGRAYNLTIKDNKVYNNKNHGIMCSNGCDDIIIESNKVFSNAKSGIILYGNARDSSIRNNLVLDNKNDQITLNNAQNNKIYYNNLQNGKSGIRLSHNSSNNSIYDNVVTNSSQYGIYALDGASRNMITQNMINGTSIYGIYIQDQKTDYNIFQDNYLLNNNEDAVGLYNLNGSHQLFVRNKIEATSGFEYSLVKSNLHLVDTDFSPSALRSTSGIPLQSLSSSSSNKITITYSCQYILEKSGKTMAKASSPTTAILSLLSSTGLTSLRSQDTSDTVSLTMLYSSINSLLANLLLSNCNSYLPSIDYYPPNNPRAFQYPNGPVIEGDPNLKIEKVFEGIKFPTTMAFLNTSDILVLEKNNGTVRRIVNGNILTDPLIRVSVADQGERGMLGVAVAKNLTEHSTNVFLYYTASVLPTSSHVGWTKYNDDCNSIVVKGKGPIYNLLCRYQLVDNKLENPKLLLKVPATPGPFHNGGKIVVGPDNALYIVIGDISGHETQAENFDNGTLPDGTGGILRLDQNGKPILSQNNTTAIQKRNDKLSYPLNLYYAYGIRNSLGMDFDPVSKKLWDTENGPNFGDEINLVEPGFNSGWAKVQGIWRANGEQRGPLAVHPERYLVDLGGKGKYYPPQFIWNQTVGPTALKFLNSDKLGKQYKNDIFVGDFHTGTIYHFKLNQERTKLLLREPFSLNSIANNTADLEKGGNIFAHGFGGITDIQVGPRDGYLYVVALHNGGGACVTARVNNNPCVPYSSSSLEGTIFRIIPISKSYH